MRTHPHQQHKPSFTSVAVLSAWVGSLAVNHGQTRIHVTLWQVACITLVQCCGCLLSFASLLVVCAIFYIPQHCSWYLDTSSVVMVPVQLLLLF